MSGKKIAATILGGVAVAGAALLIYKLLKNRYSFVEEQNINLELLPPSVLEDTLDEDATYRSKLECAKVLLENKEQEHAVDCAGFLAFAALEDFLRSLFGRFDVNLKSKLRGIKDACIRLRSIRGKALISSEDFSRLKEITQTVRNPIVHGEQYCRDKVPEAVSYIDDFITRYEQAPAYLASAPV